MAPFVQQTGRLRGRYMFRAAVRLVIEYMDWITGESTLDDIGDDVPANVKIAQRRRTQEKKGLAIEVKSNSLPVEFTTFSHYSFWFF